jgi:hypothetical protein
LPLPRAKATWHDPPANTEFAMKAEIQAAVDDIRESLTLLRRHL